MVFSCPWWDLVLILPACQDKRDKRVGEGLIYVVCNL
jgi:hypothetical protein